MARAAIGAALALLVWSCGDAAKNERGSDPVRMRGPLPAEVQAIIYAHCTACHAELPFFGARMPLTRTQDFHAPAPSDPSRPVYELVAERIHDPATPMPPWPYARLDREARATLEAWIEAGAPAGDPDEPRAPAPERTDLAPTLGSTEDCEQVFEIRAHREPSPQDQAPFVFDAPADRLECFVFRAPWQVPMQALRFEPLIDNAQVVHHVGLAAVAPGTKFSVDGKVSPCRPDHDPVAYPLAFFSPGGGASIMPDGVGFKLPVGDDAYYLLQMHYSAETGRHEDRSGYRICATSTLQKHEAQIHWLGSERLTLPAGQTVQTSAECPVRGDAPVHVVSITPHMHRLGRAMRIERISAAGKVEVLHDAPFAFDEQRLYPVDWMLAPGDVIRTTCTHQNDTTAPVGFGHASSDEMCYAWAVAYPPGRLSDRPAGDEQHGCIAR